MSENYDKMVKYTGLFMNKHCDNIQSVIPDSVVSYGYHADCTSEVCFEFSNDAYYKFEINPSTNIITLYYNDNEKATYSLTEYKKMLSIMPFVKVDYSKVFEIFDFIENNDLKYNSIKTCKRFNKESFYSDECVLSLNDLSVSYIINYKNIYKKIHKKAKFQTTVSLKMLFNENMDIDVRYFINLSFVSNRTLDIYFDFNKNFYVCNNVEMTKDELFKTIVDEREYVIKRDINKILHKSGIDMDIDFDNNFKDQIDIFQMLTI